MALDSELTVGKTSDLRRRFGLILALALLPILLLSIWQSYHDYKRETQLREIALEVSAEEAVSDIVDLLKTAKSVLNLSADLVRPETCQVDLGRVMRGFPDIYNMATYWGEDEEICEVRSIRTNAPLSAALENMTPEYPYKLNVLEFDADNPGPRRTLVMAHGNFDAEKNLKSIFFSSYDLSTLRNLRNREILPNDVKVSIFSRDGQILVGDNNSTKNVRESWAALLDNQDRVTMSLPDSQGKPREIILLPTTEKELFLAISRPTPSLISWNRVNPWASILLPILGWIFAYIAIWLALDTLILSRIRAMRRDVLKFSHSNIIPPLGKDKNYFDAITDLRKSFRTMSSRIVDRETELRTSLREKDDILREVHHRVKNNLQIIISLLNMGKRQVDDPYYTQALDDTRNRITAISQVHKTLHESDAMLSVDLVPFMKELTARLSKALDFKARNIKIVSHVDAGAVNADTATPLSLFMVEALTNSAKHGLPDGGTISTTLVEANGVLTLTVQDNGIGAEAASKRDAISPELSTSTGTGQKLMQGFARQLGGTYISESSSQGYMCRLSFHRSR